MLQCLAWERVDGVAPIIITRFIGIGVATTGVGSAGIAGFKSGTAKAIANFARIETTLDIFHHKSSQVCDGFLFQS